MAFGMNFQKAHYSVGYDVNQSNLESVAMDEVWDCVIVTINIQNKISFEILTS
jgi:hypothetical protein